MKFKTCPEDQQKGDETKNQSNTYGVVGEMHCSYAH